MKGQWPGQLIGMENYGKCLFLLICMVGYRKMKKGKVVRVVREAYVQVPKKNGKTIIGRRCTALAMYREN